MTEEQDKALNWCSKNISTVKYYMPGSGAVRHGGIGWEFNYHGNYTHVWMEDKKMLTMFLLQFSSPYVKVLEKKP